jgi:hypothetical protein
MKQLPVGAVSGTAEYDERGELNLTPANYVFGRGKIDGRTAGGRRRFTVRGGSADASISTKPLMAEEMRTISVCRSAASSKVPAAAVRLNHRDQGDANLPGGIGGTRAYWYTTANMAGIARGGSGPGSVAGLGAARLAAIARSPELGDVCRRSAGREAAWSDLTKQELGGADIQTRAGGVDHASPPRKGRCHARRFLSYLPSSV